MKELVKPNLLEKQEIPANFYGECSDGARCCSGRDTDNRSLDAEDEILF